MSGNIGGHRIIDDSIPSNKLTAQARSQILDQVLLIFPLRKKAVAAPVVGNPTLFTFTDSTGVSAGPAAAGVVLLTNESVKEYSNVGLLTVDGDQILSGNGRPVWGRVTAATGSAPTTYTVTVYDDADQTAASPVPINWDQGTMGATIGIVEAPFRKTLSTVSQLDLRTPFVGLNVTERDQETLNDISEIYAKTGVVEGSANTYSYGRFITNGDSLKAAIDKLDNQLFSTNQAVSTETTNRTNADSAIQTELDATQTGAGLNTNGTYSADATTSYLGAATSLKDADKKLDTATKNVADRATALETAGTTLGIRVTNETPGGSVGVGNLSFTIAHAPKAGSAQVVVGSVVMLEGTHYTISGTTLTYISGNEPVASEWHRISYWY